MNILMSACLLGQACRYDGQSKIYDTIQELLQNPDIHVIPVCPEQAGGLATPRDPAERCGKRVMTCKGKDVTEAYEKGASEAWQLAKLFHCHIAVLKSKSPSCGCKCIYDGTFSHNLVAGEGVTAAFLKEKGMTVIDENMTASIY